MAFHESPVDLGDLALLELLGEALRRLGLTREQHHARYGSVQTVRDPKIDPPRLAVALPQVVLDERFQGDDPLRHPLRQQTGRLAGGEAVVVLVQDMRCGVRHGASFIFNSSRSPWRSSWTTTVSPFS